MVCIFQITFDLIAALRFTLRLIEDDLTDVSSSTALEDDSVPSAGVEES